MRQMVFALLLLATLLTSAEAGVRGFKGNDTGGIIAWSPEAQRHMRVIAREHCARYGKRARITSVYARYGQYIAFACQFPPGYVVGGRSRAVLRARY